MGGLFTLVIVGLAIYMLFSRNGGMGCCGGHHDHHSGDSAHRNPATRVNPPDEWKGDVIDLDKDDYQVISVNDAYEDRKK